MRSSILVIALFLAACDGCVADTSLLGPGLEVPDGGIAEPFDTGPRDTGVRDTGPRDTGVRDIGPRDTGVRDIGPRDTGVRDTGARDTGVPDAGCLLPNISFQIGGTVTAIQDPNGTLSGAISTGLPLLGRYTFDPTAQDSNGDPAVGDYRHSNACYGIQVTISGMTFGTDPNDVDFLFEVIDNPAGQGEDAILLRSYRNRPTMLANGRTVDPDGISWQLDNRTGAALMNDRLVTMPPMLSLWSQQFGLTIAIQGPNGESVVIRGEIDSVF